MVELVDNRYGKSRVRLMKVARHGGVHELYDWTVEILLRGDFTAAHVDGDNSSILATDTMKNMVYSVARSSSATTMEAYAKELIDVLLQGNPQVASAEVEVRSALWKRLTIEGRPDPVNFMRGSGEEQTTCVTREQNGSFGVTSGLDNVVLLKTAGSGFSGFLKDRWTTLKETDDRLLGTAMRATWRYVADQVAYEKDRHAIRESLLHTFAGHRSLSVQQTLYAMAEAALETCASISDIEIVMPNKHCLLVDLSRFEQDNPNEIFVPTDEPHGYIEARVRRRTGAL